MIDVKGLSVRFGEKEVLKDIDLSIGESEALVIMGASGGGKSTLLRCVAGLLAPSGGTVIVDGIDVRRDPEGVRRQIGFVFQAAALFDYLSVRENVLFGVRRQRHLSRTESEKLVSDLLRQVGLEDAADLMPSELSGGMRKRVGLARALALKPKIILYDEPTSGLDPVTAYSIDQLIVETQQELGVTSVIVSHDVTSILRIAQRVVFLDSGTIAYDGPTQGILNSSNSDLAEMVDRSRATTLS